MKRLPRSFYERDPKRVAKDLLGKIIVHRSPEGVTSGRIVETEAYYANTDPASRACRRRTALNEIMWGHGGLAFIYMIHAKWVFNATADREGVPGAVLLRAIEPIEGVELMKRRRGIEDERLLASGPGRLTQAMGITCAHHKIDLTKSQILTIIHSSQTGFMISRSHRIGVKIDLKEKLRFFIDGNLFVSKAKPRFQKLV